MNKLTIFRCSMPGLQQSQFPGQHHWFISLADEKEPGTDKDVDYYTCKDGTIFPPTTGWIPSGKNAKPGPIVMKVEPTSKSSESDATTVAMAVRIPPLEQWLEQWHEQWHPRLSYSNKIQLHQAAHENLLDCQCFLTLATIVCFIKTEPYEVMNEETGHLVVPSSCILMFRYQHRRILLRMIASYLCGGEETRYIWHLIRKEAVRASLEDY